ncbi:MAG: dihydroorotate dehydrogenase electron transfer subunit [Bacteroidales bacterium]
MKKHVMDLVVVSNEVLSDSYFLLKLTPKELSLELPVSLPGQFVEIRVDNSAKTFLRRPISINYVDYNAREIWLLIQKVGAGTQQLSLLSEGETINIIYPLGNSFSIPESKEANLLLIGGGVGVAPMLYLGAYLKEKGYKVSFLLGARSSNDLVMLEQFSTYGDLYLTTEDGSMGEKGYVTEHSVLKNCSFDNIYTCGPKPMMKAVANFATKNGVSCEVSLENTMACGFGVCLCCVEDTVDGHVCVCKEGPVFNLNQLKW